MKLEKRVQIALPVKVSTWTEAGKPVSQMACTFDVSEKGARLVGVQVAKQVGDIVVLERGKNKAIYRIMWVGKPGSPLDGQMGVCCVELDKMIWDVDLHELEEQYEPIVSEIENPLRMTGPSPNASGIDGKVTIYSETGAFAQLEGKLLRLSYTICEFQNKATLTPQTVVYVLLITDAVDIRMRALVHSCANGKISLRLEEIRRGDRRKLRYLLEPQSQQQPKAVVAKASN